MEIPKQVTRNQSIYYATIAFCDLLNSANKDDFNIKNIETFMLGAMEAHSKADAKRISEVFKEKYKDKKYKIEVKNI